MRNINFRYVFISKIIVLSLIAFLILTTNRQSYSNSKAPTLVKITTDSGSILIGYIEKKTKDKIYIRNKYGNFMFYKKELRRMLVIPKQKMHRLNYLSCSSFELDYRDVWKINWVPEWAGIKLQANKNAKKFGKTGLFCYTSSINLDSESHTWIHRKDYIFWSTGKSAIAWIWFNAQSAHIPVGHLYLKIVFYAANNDELATHSVKLDKNSLKKYKTKKWGRLFLRTPPAPAGTERINIYFGLLKPQGHKQQLKVHIDNAFLTGTH